MREAKTDGRKVLWLILVVLILHDALIAGILATFGVWPFGQPAGKQAAFAVLPSYGRAPSLVFSDLKGARRSLADFRGHVVLVNFWGTWCPSCCEELPGLDVVYRGHREEGLDLIAMAVEFAPDAEARLDGVRVKVRELGLTCLVGMGDEAMVKAFGGKVENFPQTYLIDRDGIIRAKVIGARKKDYWEKLVQKILREEGV